MAIINTWRRVKNTNNNNNLGKEFYFPFLLEKFLLEKFLLKKFLLEISRLVFA